MEISVIAAIVIPVTCVMYKLKYDYGDYYNKKLSIVILAFIILGIATCLAFLAGADYLSPPTDLSKYPFYTTVQNIAASLTISFGSWSIILFLPTNKSRDNAQ